jgi:hypothetical protein
MELRLIDIFRWAVATKSLLGLDDVDTSWLLVLKPNGLAAAGLRIGLISPVVSADLPGASTIASIQLPLG